MIIINSFGYLYKKKVVRYTEIMNEEPFFEFIIPYVK